MNRFKSDPKRRPLPEHKKSEVSLKRQAFLTRHRLEIELPQDFRDEQPDQVQRNRTSGTASDALAERFRGFQVVVPVLGIKSWVVRRQPPFRPKLERLFEESRASCSGEVADLAGDLSAVSINTSQLHCDESGLPPGV